MHIGFDNTRRLCRNVYYFEYKEIRYKLIQNNMRKWCDVLITIVEDDRELRNHAYLVAAEFLSALSWQNNSYVKLQNLGGMSVPYNYQLRKAKCRVFGFPKVPFSGYAVGYDICVIPEVETEEQKTALALFREALSSNSDYLAFLFFWQVLEIGNKNAIGWVNKAYRKYRDKIRITEKEIKYLPLKGRNLGDYLSDDCRHAIAHIKRKPRRVKIKLDSPEDNLRISISKNVVKEFARYYIWNNLKLQKKNVSC